MHRRDWYEIALQKLGVPPAFARGGRPVTTITCCGASHVFQLKRIEATS